MLPLFGLSLPIPLQPVQPSMWWIVERSPVGWVESFSIDAPQQRVNVIVSSDRWNLADYLQRLSFLRQLGQEAQKSGYGVLLVNSRQERLAEYKIQGQGWAIEPDSLGALPFRQDTGRRP
jgi:hypothetical protein